MYIYEYNEILFGYKKKEILSFVITLDGPQFAV